MNHRLLTLMLPLLALVTGLRAQDKPFKELIFIDHQNLRYLENEKTTEFQVGEIKKNLDQAVKDGINTYLLFAKDTMEAMLNYDYGVPGIGDIGRKAFPPDGEHRKTAARLRKALNEVLDYAKEKKVRVFFHSNQFIFPKEVMEVIKPATWGTAVCPGREATWQVYRGKLEEFFNLFPSLAGLQITGDETQVSVLECKCDRCKSLNFVERVNLLTKETADACKRHGMEVQMRTWQRMGELEKDKDPSRMGEGLPDNVFFSIKNTSGDFHLPNPVDEKFIKAADPQRVVVEFDAWREYDGHNYFPCYLGDVWAPRMKLIHDRGIRRMAVRLMWNSNKNPMFERPWANFVNIYTFLKFAEDPTRDPDSILRQFVNEIYPASAREAAFKLYKFSPEFQQTIYYVKGQYTANHSRVQDEDAATDLKEIQKNGFLKTREQFDERRKEIDGLYATANQLIDQLGKDVPAPWIKELKDGARVEQCVALSTTDKMEVYFLKQQAAEGKDVQKALAELKTKMEQRAGEWKVWHPESYVSMEAEAMLAPFKEPSKQQKN